jgi:DNA-binding response OmpR family regulator
MRKKRILVVDDVKETLMALKIRLEYSGYEVLTAPDGELGLKLAREENPDLIILDVMLPKIDGFSVCRLLKFDEDYEHIPIIMLTAKGQETDKAIGKEVGADVYLTKPYNPRELIYHIERLTGSSGSAEKLNQLIQSGNRSTK